MSPISFFKFSSRICGSALGILALALAFSTSVRADMNSWGAARVLQEALASGAHMNIYNDNRLKGFNLSGGLFSGRASGIDTTASTYLGSSVNDGMHYDNAASLEGDQRVYAMMIDGSYQFDNDLGTGLPLHPYMSSGFGMAVYDTAANAASTLTPQGGDMVPLFRVGAGVAYQLGEQWNMSLDYKVGISGSDSYLAARGISATDMQAVNMGMHYRF